MSFILNPPEKMNFKSRMAKALNEYNKMIEASMSADNKKAKILLAKFDELKLELAEIEDTFFKGKFPSYLHNKSIVEFPTTSKIKERKLTPLKVL